MLGPLIAPSPVELFAGLKALGAEAFEKGVPATPGAAAFPVPLAGAFY